MTYTCIDCNYVSDDSANYHRHKKTKKHINNHKNTVNSLAKNGVKFTCQICGQEYSQSQGLSRHKKKCISNKDVSKISADRLMEEFSKYNTLVRELIEKNQKLEHDKNEVLERENKYMKNLVNEAGSMVKTSITALTFATKYYTETPILQPLKDCDELESDDNQLVDLLVFYQKQNMIAKYLGDFLVKIYKTTNPENQSMWSADVSRLNYIVRLVCGSNNKPEWCKDNNGIKIKNTIVTPMLDHINKKIEIYIKIKAKEILNSKGGEMSEIINKLTIGTEISRDITTNLIADNIIRYIAPHFSMDTNLLLANK